MDRAVHEYGSGFRKEGGHYIQLQEQHWSTEFHV